MKYIKNMCLVVSLCMASMVLAGDRLPLATTNRILFQVAQNGNHYLIVVQERLSTIREKQYQQPSSIVINPLTIQSPQNSDVVKRANIIKFV